MNNITTLILVRPLSLCICLHLLHIDLSKLNFVVRCDVHSNHLIIDIAHNDAMSLVLLRHLSDLHVLVHLMRIRATLLARTAVFGTWRHYLKVLVHGLVQVGRASCLLTWSAQYLYVLHGSLKVLQLAAAVHVVAAVHGVVRAHPLNNEAVFDHLVHVRLLAVQALLYLVVGLLHQSGVLIEIDSRQIIMRLLGKGSLLCRGFDHPSIVLTLLKQIILLRLVHVGRRLLNRQLIGRLRGQCVIRENIEVIVVLREWRCFVGLVWLIVAV